APHTRPVEVAPRQRTPHGQGCRAGGETEHGIRLASYDAFDEVGRELAGRGLRLRGGAGKDHDLGHHTPSRVSASGSPTSAAPTAAAGKSGGSSRSRAPSPSDATNG